MQSFQFCWRLSGNVVALKSWNIPDRTEHSRETHLESLNMEMGPSCSYSDNKPIVSPVNSSIDSNRTWWKFEWLSKHDDFEVAASQWYISNLYWMQRAKLRIVYNRAWSLWPQIPNLWSTLVKSKNAATIDVVFIVWNIQTKAKI